ncbi:MFS transporter [Alloalcanivorax venustensis]|jgi:MFS transporter, DHA2 family, multidrug resistance protein|uniref:Major facilitator superfamily multidrug efflux transporter n=3 Tax=Alloalcanivorax venustensis TaxID=172371 RepID=A0ABS0AG88_9GAMM|nr:MFS transporter [Alloalcanivorax venustensis]MBF5052914.1 major facilitator superfamily multidrug efflux transporter [Alloalcanivorax venustensis ISO4]
MTSVPATAPAQPVFGPRLAAGLTGVFIAAIMAGLNSRVASLALMDIRGAHGFGVDPASWLDTVYLVGEIAVQPFAAWFAITFSLRRYQMALISVATLLALLLPFAQSLPAMLVLRSLQGIVAGGLIPTLMMAALRFLPLPIRLHGLALYAMTATLAPNLAVWLAGAWTDQLFDWRWIYWQVVPLGLLSLVLCAWGLPQDPPRHERFGQGNWVGHVLLVTGLALLAVAMSQGVRLNWFHSPLITGALTGGLIATAAGLISEWRHPSPFIRLQLLARRNLGLGFTLFIGLLVLFLSGALLPMHFLAEVQGYRPLQSGVLSLIIGLPQLVLGSLVALMLYRPWVDARKVLAAGLVLLALSCWLGAQVNSEWMWRQFVTVQVLQSFGQPMAVVSLLFLSTSVVQPEEGPFVSGMVNMLRAFGTALGSALITQMMLERGRFHSDMLLGNLARAGATLGLHDDRMVALSDSVATQATTLATADAYRVLGILALVLIPLALCLTPVAPPRLPSPSTE